MQVTIELPQPLFDRLIAIQAFLEKDTHDGETAPSIEDLVIDAVCETFG